MTPYTFQRGETLLLALDAVGGDPLTVSAITASMKKVSPGRTGVSPGTPVAANFDVVLRAAAGNIPAGWTLSIAAANSAALTAGSYLADARLSVAGGVVITESVAIRLVESVSA